MMTFELLWVLLRGVLMTVPLAMMLMPASAAAMVWKLGAHSGLMQQPTSSYYHAVYGGALEAGNQKESFLIRLGYLERPRFELNGFRDQEFFSYVMVGTRVLQRKSHNLLAHVGVGRAQGVLAETAEGGEDRHFGMTTLAVSMEYALRLGGFEWGLGHQMLLGNKSAYQSRSQVVWPYSFFLMKLGWTV